MGCLNYSSYRQLGGEKEKCATLLLLAELSWFQQLLVYRTKASQILRRQKKKKRQKKSLVFLVFFQLFLVIEACGEVSQKIKAVIGTISNLEIGEIFRLVPTWAMKKKSRFTIKFETPGHIPHVAISYHWGNH